MVKKSEANVTSELARPTASTSTAATSNPVVVSRSSTIQRHQEQQRQPRQSSGNVNNLGLTGSEESPDDYGKDIKDIPRSVWRLLTNKIYLVTCLGACMELVSVHTSWVFIIRSRNTRSCLSRLSSPDSSCSFPSIWRRSSTCQSRWRPCLPGALPSRGPASGSFSEATFSRGCNWGQKEPFNSWSFSTSSVSPATRCSSFSAVKTSRWPAPQCHTTWSESPLNSNFPAKKSDWLVNFYSHTSEPFQINLTASCNFGCECDMNDVQPVCGANGLTYFSPCHAGCTSLGANSDNYTNCACEFKNSNVMIANH